MAAPADGDQLAGSKLLEELRALNRELEVPTPEAWGIGEAKWNGLVQTMAAQALASGSPANNPRVPDAEDIVALYGRAFRG